MAGSIVFGVQGTSYYKIVVLLSGKTNKWKSIAETGCDCPAADHRFCKHQVAALLWMSYNLLKLGGTVSAAPSPTPKSVTDLKSKIPPAPRLRPALEPFLISDFEQVSSFIQYHEGPFYELPHKGIESIQETAPGEIAVQAWYSYHDNIQYADRYLIRLQVKKTHCR